MTAPRGTRRRLHGRQTRGFTLAELIVAGVMIALLVGAVYVSVSSTIRARSSGEARVQAGARVNAAADLIARELRSALRASDLYECKIAIVRQGPPGRGQDGLLLFAHVASPIRPYSGQPEGDECETQFRLQPSELPDRSVLWVRRSPVPDDYPDAGGVATPVVEGLTALTIDAYDGASWRDAWDSDADGLPHALRVLVTGVSDDGRVTSSARRVVAFDRVPPRLPEDQSGSGEQAPDTGGAP